MKRQFFYSVLTSLLLVIGWTFNSFAQFEEGKETVTVKPIIGGDIVVGATTPPLIYTGTTGELPNPKIKNIVTFKINEQSGILFSSGFEATVIVKEEMWPDASSNNGQITKFDTLKVNYDPAQGSKYDVRAYVTFNGFQKFIITVQSLTIANATGWNPIVVLQLENEMRVLRYYTLKNATPNFLTPVPNADGTGHVDAIEVGWTWPTGNSNPNNNVNQLEWAWASGDVSFYPNINQLFLESSSRVDLDHTQNKYKIPLLYDGAGTLYYRLRPALRKNDGTVIAGDWSTPQPYPFAGHQTNLNWQSSSTFAEGGKRKTVIQYFDGSLRSRQTVTKDNTTGNTIVGETIYDMQGRPNVQILPTPTDGSVIQYFSGFNRFKNPLTEQVQSATDDPAKYFDLTPSDVKCLRTFPLDSASGNGKYYSNQNPWLGTENKSKFIPDAEGYAYTETRYTDDATQRITSQGGVGINHQIGSGHETKYFYGKPSQQELDALFGTEVGDASHYFKNMVQDANGQMSVSYVDMHGRTIATALAGDSTENLQAIYTNHADYPDQSGVTLVNKLLTPATNIVKGNSIESLSTLLVPAQTDYAFTYKLTPDILTQFDCNSQSICFDCKYDLEISIRSEGCEEIPPTVRRYNNLQIVPANLACGTPMGFSGEGLSNVTQINFNESLRPGSYIIRKTLTLSDSLYSIRKDSAMRVFLCRTQQNIYDSIYNIVSYNCGDTTTATACASCNANLGTYLQYKANNLGVPDSVLKVQYTKDSTECAMACGNSPKQNTLYAIRRQMLMDMVPYSGQYARSLDTVNFYNYTLEKKYNIFVKTYNGVSTGRPFFRFPKTEANQPAIYRTEDNQADSSLYDNDGNYLLPVTANPIIADTDFVKIFQRSWADSLLFYHPEFTKLKYAEGTMKACYQWQDKVEACQTYAEAQAKGYINPMSGLINSGADPYFVQFSNYTSLQYIEMNKRITLNMFLDDGGSWYGPSIWQIANGSVLCSATSIDTSGNIASPRYTCILGTRRDGLSPLITGPASQDTAWNQFKRLYFSFRNSLVLQYINIHAPSALSQTDMNTLSLQEHKQLRFASPMDMANQNNAGAIWQILADQDSNAGQVLSAGQTFSATNTTDKCLAQKPFWHARLLQCEQFVSQLSTGLAADTVAVNIIINTILDGFVSVCHHSVDGTYIYGATSVNPDYAGTPQSFEDVVKAVFLANNIHTLPGDNYFCNPFTVDFPKPFGKNPPLMVNTSAFIDSCGCKRAHELKIEAFGLGYTDTTSLTVMNNFLQARYNQTLSPILWEGLKKCDRIIRDTCYTKTLILSGRVTCHGPVIQTAYYLGLIYSKNSAADLKVRYHIEPNFQSALLTVTAPGVNRSQIVDINSDSLIVTGLNMSKDYTLTLSATSSSCGTLSYSYLARLNGYVVQGQGDVPAEIQEMHYTDLTHIEVTYISSGSYCGMPNTYLRLHLSPDGIHDYPASIPNSAGTHTVSVTVPACTVYGGCIYNTYGTCPNASVGQYVSVFPKSFGKPQISNVAITSFTPTTENVTVNYTNPYYPAPNTVTNGQLYVCQYDNPSSGSTVSTSNSATGSVVIPNLPGCQRYKFVAKCTLPITNTEIVGDTAILTTCFQYFCETIYSPIPLGQAVVIPPVLSCNYQRPCITCDQLNTYTNEFKTLYPSYDVPYTDSITMTSARAKQNSLWARFLNYRTGFSKGVSDYVAAYNNCHSSTPPATALCAFDPPLNSIDDYMVPDSTPCKSAQTQAQFMTQLLYQQMKDSLMANFDSLYKAKCLNAKKGEEFYVESTPKEYHYTLNYYDQAGNLVKTLPPAAVKPHYGTGYFATIASARVAGTILINNLNNEALATHYRYNTINKIIAQKTPDAGVSNFWYDALGRFAFAQNAKQQTLNKYSYTLYDALGRITEVGEVDNTYSPDPRFNFDEEPIDWWTTAGTKKEVTQTGYDIAYGTSTAFPKGLLYGVKLNQNNLRNRISYSTYSNVIGALGTHDAATYYCYDIHGNVDTLLQDDRSGMGLVNCTSGSVPSGNRYKKIEYNYDLISGKTNMVMYQRRQKDQIYYRYQYDDENRISNVLLSKDSLYWEKDASYEYYRHGPLARTVLGQNQVQGLDYAYTIQGWLKGMNDIGTNMGADGGHSLVSADAFGFSLNYFSGDYNPIGNVPGLSNLPSRFDPSINSGLDLFNGNIRALNLNIPAIGGALYSYKYDQLNRLVSSELINEFSFGGPSFFYKFDDYHEALSYDPNGNIRGYLRNGTSDLYLDMDSLTYEYIPNTNKIRRVHDAVDGVNYIGDIDQQADPNNYVYDLLGNLIHDTQGGLDSIKWNVYGKISRIKKNDGTVITYSYDADGNRISKIVNGRATYYVRDAKGNIISVYHAGEPGINGGHLSQTEIDFYGSSRLGIINTSIDMQDCNLQVSNKTIFTRGNKQFELTDNRGNVYVTISDKKVSLLAGVSCPHFPCPEPYIVYIPDVISANDYSSFGAELENRKLNSENQLYGFNGQRKENDMYGEGNAYDFGDRIQDPRLGRWLSVDPLQAKYPGESPYMFAGSNPILFKDPDGKDRIITIYFVDAGGHMTCLGTRTVPDCYKTGTYEKTNIFSQRHYYKADIEETVVLYANEKTIDKWEKEGQRYPVSMADYYAPQFLGGFHAFPLPSGQSDGPGYTQAAGFSMSGGSGTTLDFKDKAGVNLGSIDMATLFGFMASADNALGVKDLFTKIADANAIEKFNQFMENVNSLVSAGEQQADAIEQTKKLFFEKKEEKVSPTPTPTPKSSQRNAAPVKKTTSSGPADSITVDVIWQGKTKDGKNDSGSITHKTIVNPEKKKK